MKNSVIFILVALSVCLTDCDSPLEEEIFKSNNEIFNKFSVRIMVSGDCSSEENSGNDIAESTLWGNNAENTYQTIFF